MSATQETSKSRALAVEKQERNKQFALVWILGKFTKTELHKDGPPESTASGS